MFTINMTFLITCFSNFYHIKYLCYYLWKRKTCISLVSSTVVPNRCAATHLGAATSTQVCREAMLFRRQKLYLAISGSQMQNSHDLGKKLRDHRHILSKDLFFRDYYEFGTKIEKLLTNFK